MDNMQNIKYAQRVLNGITDKPGFFQDIQRHTSLDTTTLQKVLAKLTKLGYISKNERGLYILPALEAVDK